MNYRISKAFYGWWTERVTTEQLKRSKVCRHETKAYFPKIDTEAMGFDVATCQLLSTIQISESSTPWNFLNNNNNNALPPITAPFFVHSFPFEWAIFIFPHSSLLLISCWCCVLLFPSNSCSDEPIYFFSIMLSDDNRIQRNSETKEH